MFSLQQVLEFVSMDSSVCVRVCATCVRECVYMNIYVHMPAVHMSVKRARM